MDQLGEIVVPSELEKIHINYLVSFGSCCHTASFFKENGLKKISYPFDWVLSGPDIVYDTLCDNFSAFLDKSQYIKQPFFDNNRCGHVKYGYRFFNHKYPIGDQDYLYYVRCVDRLNKTLQKNEPKLFIITNVQHDRDQKLHNNFTDIEIIKKINDKLKTLTTDFYILYINPILVVPDNISNTTTYKLINHPNVYVVDLYCESLSDGVRFLNKTDNINYKKNIQDLFDIALKNDIQ